MTNETITFMKKMLSNQRLCGDLSGGVLLTRVNMKYIFRGKPGVVCGIIVHMHNKVGHAIIR